VGSAEFVALCSLGEEVLLSGTSCDFGANQERRLAQFPVVTSIDAHPCPVCGSALESRHGIEVGHIFMLQTQYAEKLGATFHDVDGSVQPLWMGCYGIGVTRLLQTIVEQSCDQDGIIWPDAIAPYLAIIVPINIKDTTQRTLAETAYRQLNAHRISCLLDDRGLRGGRKFMDADLFGIPWRVVIGRDAATGQVELKRRGTDVKLTVSVEELVQRILSRDI